MSNENEIERDEYGFDENGEHANGTRYDDCGFDFSGAHRDTGTEFSPHTRLTRDGDRYDSEGYDYQGYDRDGYDSAGYGPDGYNEDGEDRRGNTRCDNGDCDEWDCDCRRGSGVEQVLDDYSTCVISAQRWRPIPNLPHCLYAGLELEMYSRDDDPDDVHYVLNQINGLYRQCDPLSRSGNAAIATHDGSLDHMDGGFEVKVVPLTKRQMYHIFRKIDTVGDGKCMAWHAGEYTGNHIHISRAALTDLTVGKLGVFINDEFNRPLIEHVAGRGATYNHFQHGKTIKCRSSGHSCMLDTTRSETIEFRMFRSNLRGEGILKNYEFVLSMIAFCNAVNIQRISLDWNNYLRWLAANHGAYKYLHRFFKRPGPMADRYLPLLPKNARRPSTDEKDAA